MWPKEKLIDEIQKHFIPCHSLGQRTLGREESSEKQLSFLCVVLRGFFMYFLGFCFSYFQKLNQPNHL